MSVIQTVFQRTFDVFSRRRRGGKYPADEISPELRRRALMYFVDLFSGKYHGMNYRGASLSYNRAEEFVQEIHTTLQRLVARTRLTTDDRAPRHLDAEQDFALYMQTCPPADFLDAVELAFRTEVLWHVTNDEQQAVDGMNEVFRVSGSPYRLTPFVKVHEPSTTDHGNPCTSIRTVAVPQVMRVDEEVTHTMAVDPALAALADPGYASANGEFRAALADCRKGDYGDCLTKCGSAFESVMKVLCAKKRWPVPPKAVASQLLDEIFKHVALAPFFKQTLMLVATMRNQLSTAHGGGTTPRAVERHVAEYAIASTAAGILLLVREAGE